MSIWTLNGQPIAYGREFTVGTGKNAKTYSKAWWRKSSPAEKEALGLVEHEQQPKPSEDWHFVNPDPENPGQWISTPFSLDRVLEKKLQQLAQHRWTVQNSGMIWEGFNVHTDDEARGAVDSEYAAARDGIREDGEVWKFMYGVFSPLTNQQVIDMALAMRLHVKACFAAEAIHAMAMAGIVADANMTTEQKFTALVEYEFRDTDWPPNPS